MNCILGNIFYSNTLHVLYSLLADSKQHARLTGHKAKISRKIGGPFSTHGGHISGILVDLVPGKRLVQAWRTKEFPLGIFSLVTLQISPTRSGGAEVVLIHRGVPKLLIPKIEKMWKTGYWEKLRHNASVLFPKSG